MDNKQQAATQSLQDTQQQNQQQKAPALQELNKVGGFGFIETVVDGIANMNPTRKARKEIFLNDSNKAVERKDLLQKINLWVSLLENHNSAEEMAEPCRTKSVSAEKNLKSNLKNTLDAVRNLETSYRTVAQF